MYFFFGHHTSYLNKCKAYVYKWNSKFNSVTYTFCLPRDVKRKATSGTVNAAATSASRRTDDASFKDNDADYFHSVYKTDDIFLTTSTLWGGYFCPLLPISRIRGAYTAAGAAEAQPLRRALRYPVKVRTTSARTRGEKSAVRYKRSAVKFFSFIKNVIFFTFSLTSPPAPPLQLAFHLAALSPGRAAAVSKYGCHEAQPFWRDARGDKLGLGGSTLLFVLVSIQTPLLCDKAATSSQT